MSEKLLNVSSSPHIRSKVKTSNLMRNVIIGLLPTSAAGVYLFGFRALLILLFSVCSAVFFEAMWCFINKKDLTISDFSACITGLLIGLNVSVSTPLWAVFVANGFAIIIVKQLFGGLGYNVVNPAMAARAFMLISWPQIMTDFPLPGGGDAVSTATVLSGAEETIFNAFMGNIQGCIGEVSAAAIIIGGIYLILTKTIKPYIPVAFIGTVFVFTALAGENALLQILSGGLMLGAFFMATDYVTSPATACGQIVMGVGCGILTAVIRLWGSYPEGVTFAILFMNAMTPLIDKVFVPARYGKAAGK